jgi:glucosamine-phosphate N-acetyltransferase
VIRNLTASDAQDRFDEIKELFGQLSDVENLTQESLLGIMWSLPPNKSIFIKEKDNRIVGTVSLILDRKPIHAPLRVAFLEDLVVLAPYRDMGIGTELVNSVIRFSRAMRAYKVILSCNDENLGYYKKLGFKEKAHTMRLDLN